MNAKLSKLEAIRGFAAIYVVFHHIQPKLIIYNVDFSFLFKFGQEAVILFFFVSGFVIQYSYERSTDKSFKIFFFKRFLRIYIPLLIIFITNYSIFCFTINGFFPLNWKTLGGNLLMLQDMKDMLPNTLVAPFLDNAPLWSLSYEWWFYILFFFAYNGFKNNASVTVYVVGCISALTYLIYPNFINRELMYLVIWWVGADMARIYLNKIEISVKTLKIPLIALSSCTIILLGNIFIQNKFKFHGIIFVSPWLEFRHFFFALIAIFVVLLWKKINWFGFSMTIGLFRVIAPISFGIYISHWFLIINAHYLNSIINNSFVRYFFYFIICIIYSYLIEKVIFTKLNKLIISKYVIKTPPTISNVAMLTV